VSNAVFRIKQAVVARPAWTTLFFLHPTGCTNFQLASASQFVYFVTIFSEGALQVFSLFNREGGKELFYFF
jgi:hypothetical protein